MNARQLTALLVLSAFWSGSYVFIRIASPAFGPLLLMALRMVIAVTVLGLYAVVRRQWPPLRRHWRQFLLIGLLNNAVPQVLIAIAALHLPAGLTATVNATVPLFAMLIGAIWLRDALSRWQTAGLLLGLAGVAVLVGLGPIPLTAATVGATTLSLVAAVSYGVAAVYTKANVAGVQSFSISLYSLMFAAMWVVPATPFALPAASPPPEALISALLLGIVSTAFTIPLHFYLIASAGPTKATLPSYLVPAFGTLLGWIVLDEQLGPGSLLGLAMILGSVFLVNRPAPPARLRHSAGQPAARYSETRNG